MATLALLKDNAITIGLPIGILVILAFDVKVEFTIGIIRRVLGDLQTGTRLIDNATAAPVGGHRLFDHGQIAIAVAVGVNARQLAHMILTRR